MGLPYIHKCRYTQRNKYHSATARKNYKCDISKKNVYQQNVKTT